MPTRQLDIVFVLIFEHDGSHIGDRKIVLNFSVSFGMECVGKNVVCCRKKKKKKDRNQNCTFR